MLLRQEMATALRHAEEEADALRQQVLQKGPANSKRTRMNSNEPC